MMFSVVLMHGRMSTGQPRDAHSAVMILPSSCRYRYDPPTSLQLLFIVVAAVESNGMIDLIPWIHFAKETYCSLTPRIVLHTTWLQLK
jgi:hypothetical protein